MNTDDVSDIAHCFNKKIIMLTPILKHNITSAVNLALYTPLRGKQILSKKLFLEKDEEGRLWYVENQRSMKRIFVNPKELIEI